MSIRDLKKELVNYIEDTNDENLLSMLKEDLVFYSKAKDRDILDDLSAGQLAELEELANEDDEADSMTLEEFKKATDKWRMK